MRNIVIAATAAFILGLISFGMSMAADDFPIRSGMALWLGMGSFYTGMACMGAAAYSFITLLNKK